MTHALIDGSNVVRSSAWRRVTADLDERASRLALLDAVAAWIAVDAVAEQAVLVFDGTGIHGTGSRQIGDRLEVVGTGARSADDELAERASGHARAGRPWWVVSDDREVRSVAGGRADRTLGTTEFVAMLRTEAAVASRHVEAPPRSRGIVDGLPEDVRSKLERMRRGEA